jgi:Ca2+-binding RTX toxin-like protein
MAFIDATGSVTIGTIERDFITGRPEMDIILARAGDDETFRFPSGPGAGGGDDIIDAGDGDDGRELFVSGDEGNDVILGGRGFDDLSGGPDNDVIIGEEGGDDIFGGDGDDFLFGSDDRDQIFGGRGKDTITGGPGDDRLSGATPNPEETARPTSSSSTSDLASACPVSPRRAQENHRLWQVLTIKSSSSSGSMGSG